MTAAARGGRRPIGVYGGGPGISIGRGGGDHGTADECRKAMAIDWMTRDELDQAIPPAYTRFLGAFLLDAVHDRAGTA